MTILSIISLAVAGGGGVGTEDWSFSAASVTILSIISLTVAKGVGMCTGAKGVGVGIVDGRFSAASVTILSSIRLFISRGLWGVVGGTIDVRFSVVAWLVGNILCCGVVGGS